MVGSCLSDALTYVMGTCTETIDLFVWVKPNWILDSTAQLHIYAALNGAEIGMWIDDSLEWKSILDVHPPRM